MVTFVKFLGIFIAAFGLAFFINPGMIKHYMAFWKIGKRLYLGGALALLMGIVFLLAASQCRWRGFIFAFGILSIAKAVWLFASGREKILSFLDWWAKKSTLFFRIYALFVIALALLLINSV